MHHDDVSGVWAPVLTALDSNLELDEPRTLSHIQQLLTQGLRGIVLFGTTGEANSFSVIERQKLLEFVLSAGVAPEKLMIGTGCCALPDTVALTKHALSCGCRQILMLPPFYYKGVSDSALTRSYRSVIEHVADDDIRVFLYHFPALSGVPITQRLLENLLREFPSQFVGIKDSSGDRENMEMLFTRFPQLAVFPGSELFLLDGLNHGGSGCITASANVNATGISAVYEKWKHNDASVQDAQSSANQIRKMLQVYPLSAALKFILSHYHGDSGWLNIRPPLMMIDTADQAKLQSQLESIHFSI